MKDIKELEQDEAQIKKDKTREYEARCQIGKLLVLTVSEIIG